MTLQELINKFGKSYKSSSYIHDLEQRFRNAIDEEFEDPILQYLLQDSNVFPTPLMHQPKYHLETYKF